MKREDLEAEMIEYFTEEMDIFDEDYIESEIDNIICIAKNIRSKLTYNNGIYYPVENLFKEYNNLDNNYKNFVIDALKMFDIEFYTGSLYRVCC